jgi:hypothetical protein
VPDETGLSAEPDPAEAIEVLRALRWLIGARYEVITGARNAPGTAGYFAALEHLDLAEPEEFYGDTPPEAIRRAYAWAVAKAQSAPVSPVQEEPCQERSEEEGP